MEELFLFVLGTIFGSFFFALASRLPNNESIVTPGSHCDYCNHPLKWYDLIPVFSYLFSLGRCRYCKKHLSILYPIVETICGLCFVVSYTLYGLNYEFFAAVILFSLAIIIFITDFNHYIILDSPLVVSSVLIFVLKLYYFGIKAALMAFVCGLIMFTVLFVIKIFGDKLFKQESLGGGDIKLSFVVGLSLGLRLGLMAFVISSFLTLPYALCSTYFTKKKEVPFGPFIISATLIVFLFMDKFVNLINFFMFI